MSKGESNKVFEVRERLGLECSSCSKDFQLTIDFHGHPKVQRECVYCGSTGEVDISPYLMEREEIRRGGGPPQVYKVVSLPDSVPFKAFEGAE